MPVLALTPTMYNHTYYIHLHMRTASRLDASTSTPRVLVACVCGPSLPAHGQPTGYGATTYTALDTTLLPATSVHMQAPPLGREGDLTWVGIPSPPSLTFADFHLFGYGISAASVVFS